MTPLDGLTSYSVLAALTAGVTEAIKRVGIESRWLPLVALFVGIVLTFLGRAGEVTSLSILTGVAVGLGSMGLYDVVKRTVVNK